MLTRTVACLHRPQKPRPRPRPKPVTARQIKTAIDQAMLLCHNFEDTVECRLAWDLVEELSHAYNNKNQVQEDTLCEDDTLACREYDL